MASAETERLLNEIGVKLADLTAHPLGSTLLYAQLDTNMVDLSIFVEHSDHIGYLSISGELTHPLLDLWEEEDVGKRWAEIEFLLRNREFTASFTYPDEIDRAEDDFVRRDRIVARYFGTKPIVYPPLDAEDGQRFDL